MASIYYQKPSYLDYMIELDWSNATTTTFQNFTASRYYTSQYVINWTNTYTSISNSSKSFTPSNLTTCIIIPFTQEQKNLILKVQGSSQPARDISLDTTNTYPYYYSLLYNYSTNQQLSLPFCLKDTFWGASSDSTLAMDYYYSMDENNMIYYDRIEGIVIFPTSWSPSGIPNCPLYFHIKSIKSYQQSNFSRILYSDVDAAKVVHTHTVDDFTGIVPTASYGTGIDASLVPNYSIFSYNNTTGWNTITNPGTISGTDTVGLYATGDGLAPQWGIAPIAQGGTGVNNLHDFKVATGKWKYPGDTITAVTNWCTYGGFLTNSRKRIMVGIHVPYHIMDTVTAISASATVYFIGQGSRLPTSGSFTLNSSSSNPNIVASSWSKWGLINVQFNWDSAILTTNNDPVIVHVTALSFTLS